jgi:hypothetical protein
VFFPGGVVYFYDWLNTRGKFPFQKIVVKGDGKKKNSYEIKLHHVEKCCAYNTSEVRLKKK